MREKYESLALVQLKELAKVRGLKGTSTMKKAELVEAMLAEDERLKKEEEAKVAAARQTAATSGEPERTERPVRQDRPYRQKPQENGAAENVGAKLIPRNGPLTRTMWLMTRASIPRN